MLEELCDWISGTRLSLIIQNVSWIIPAVQSLHILSVAVVMSSMAMLDLRLMNLAGRRQPVSIMAGRLLPWMWSALGVLTVTGAVLIIGEPSRDLPNPVFQAKMAMLGVVVALTFVVQRQIRKEETFWETRRIAARVAAGASLLLWVAIVTAGRWSAYV